MDLVIVRHSTSLSNGADLISGADNDVRLSDAGVAYAKKVRGLYDWDRFDAVYASPMIRAIQTAAILTNHRDYVQYDARIQEMNFGKWEGLSATPFRTEHPTAFDYAGMFSAEYSKFAPQAESYAELVARCDSFLTTLKQQHPSDAVLVVCHGFTTRALFAAALHADVYAFTAVNNVALNELHLDPDDNFRARILSFNQVLA
ncbi:histidine phosphatase family protein [Lacticaseibacillus hulanensis]|uniref:histidine phosphatase family protein n=1 Tax=Lacticaseibacillus hulanensis TaxID=2493111 RepID=UPI000FDA87B9|nr:histidine phosphatase family protein [Lacticaseibacillus hulanensis]